MTLKVYYLASREFPCARIECEDKSKRKRTVRVITSSVPHVPDYVSVDHLFNTPEEAVFLTTTMLSAKHEVLMRQAAELEHMMTVAMNECIKARAILKGLPDDFPKPL